MRINHKILSIPPYISTSWKNVLSLHMEPRQEGPVLVIGLVSGSFIEVPGLDKAILQAIFIAHEKHLEQDTTPPKTALPQGLNFEGASVIGLPIRIEGMENFGSSMQHSPEASDTPDLPKEMLKKIASLTKMVGLNTDELPKAEPHCNCMHCQILRAMHEDAEQNPTDETNEMDLVVSDSDLKFRDWDIKQTTDKLYLVSNPLNQDEHYNVFLGEPLGCTCGEKNCEHIRAVLNS